MGDAVRAIARGRIGLRTDGQEHEGRLSFEKGLREAMEVFAEAQTSRDPLLMLLAEYVYIGQELAGSSPNEKEARSSCEAAMQDFDDAFLCLKTVVNALMYRGAENTHPHRAKFRYKGMPKDAFHTAYIGHRTRVKNSLRKIGVDPAEQDLQELRMSIFNTAQQVYLEKQQSVFTSS
jgi:hypothetical protein